MAIDWSGARTPKGKIWLAEAHGARRAQGAGASGVGRPSLRRLEALDTRESAIARVIDYGEYGERGAVVAVGIDFSFSLPAWFCAHLGASCAPDLWEVVARHGESWLQTCAWPFWGRPGKSRPDLPAHLRCTEATVGERLRTKPKSTFQIGGAGAVGTGSLRGMPYLRDLRRAGCAVWPFDPPGQITVFEMYPRALTGDVVKSRPKARDAYLSASPWRWSDAHRRAAVASEDAFDAAVSALAMSEGGVEFQHVPPGDSLTPIEGEIWMPARRDAGWSLTAGDGSHPVDSSRP